MDVVVFRREKHSGADGWLSELYSKKILPDFNCNHSYLVSLEPGAVRAKHYHNDKTELIAVVYGSVEIINEDIFSKKRTCTTVSTGGSHLELFLIPPNIAHVIKNVSNDTSRIIVFSDSHDLEDTISYDFGNKL